MKFRNTILSILIQPGMLVAGTTSASVVVGLCVFLATFTPAQGMPYWYVAPDGNDANPGTEASPFATLEKARNVIRDLKALPAGLPAGGVTVVLRGGVYNVENTINLTSQDSGTAGSPIIYRSAPGEVATLYGGQVLERSAFTPVTNSSILNRIISVSARASLLVCDLGAQGISDYGVLTRHGFGIGTPDTPLELFVNGQHLTRARYPNDGAGFMYIDGIVSVGAVPGDADYKTRGGVFVCNNTRPSQWAEVTNAWVNGVLSKDWAWTYNRIAGYDPGTKRITMASGEPYGLINGSDFFFVENILEEIDQPGEYYLDRITGMLYLLPPASFDDAEISVSILSDPMITLAGTEYVTFRGLRFSTSRDLAVSGTANHVRFQACEFAGFGKSGLSLTGYGNVVDSCDIHDIGGGVIKLDGGDWTTLTPSGNSVDNCYIHSWGEWQRVYNPAVDLVGVGNIVRYSKFEDFPHNAIGIRGNDHLIEYNIFVDGMKDFKDLGVIYGNLGMNPHQRGTVIRRNFFNEVSSRPKQTAIYPDNATMDWTVEENVFFRVGNADGSYGVIIGNGQSYIRVRNNVFVDCANAVEVSFFLNSWASGQVPTFQARWQDLMNTYNNFTNMPHGQKYPGLPLLLQEDRILPNSNTFKQNLVWNPTVPLRFPGAYTTRYGDLSLVQAQDNHIASSDPGFVDWQGGDFSLREDAAAFSAIPGFVAPPFREMGLRDAVGTVATVEILNTESATEVQTTSAKLHGVWQRKWGTAFEIEVFWGRTDGGTNPAAWENQASLGLLNNGVTTHFNHSVHTLDSNTTYYYTFRASNAFETIWADETGSVATLGMPHIDTAGGPTAETEGSALLRGRLASGGTAEAWICWGTTDAGTASTENWDNVVSIGAAGQGLEFARLVAGLSTNTTYFYRCYATNAVGSAWSNAATFSGKPTGAWTPEDLTGMSAWYDAADASTITASSGAVSQWRDKSASARNLNQSTSGARPQTGTRTIGGLNAIEFDGTDDVLIGSANKTDAITIFGVVLTDSGSGADANRSWLSSPGGINPDYWMKSVANSDSLGTMMCDTGGAYSSGDATAARSAAHIHAAYSWVAGGANGGTRIDGGASGASIAAKSTTLQKSATELAIGRQKNTAGRFHDGLVGEVIIINQRLTDADADFLKIEGYLAHKWGTTASLPAGHPYKSDPPGGSGAIINLAPTGISASAATFNAVLDASATNYDVTVYYGTVDGGTNAASWGSSAAVGSWENVASANISHAVSGLTAGQTYYYTFMASHTSGEVWASQSWTFKTPVTYSGLDAFNDWAASSGGGITFTGDANGDGLADGMGWLLGADGPTQDANGLLPQSAVTNGDLTLTFKMLNSGKRGTAVLRLEHSRDLGVTDPWSENTITIPDANSTVDGVEFTITPLEGTDHNQVTAILPAAAANATGKLFVRLSGVLVP